MSYLSSRSSCSTEAATAALYPCGPRELYPVAAHGSITTGCRDPSYGGCGLFQVWGTRLPISIPGVSAARTPTPVSPQLLIFCFISQAIAKCSGEAICPCARQYYGLKRWREPINYGLIRTAKNERVGSPQWATLGSSYQRTEAAFYAARTSATAFKCWLWYQHWQQEVYKHSSCTDTNQPGSKTSAG